MEFSPLDFNKTYHLTRDEVAPHDIRPDGTSPNYPDSIFSYIIKPSSTGYTFSITRKRISDTLSAEGEIMSKKVQRSKKNII